MLGYTTRRFIILAVTNQRVIVGAGIFAQELFFLPLAKIETVEMARSPIGMLLGYSSVIVSGTGRMRLIVPFVSNPGAIAEEITRSIMEKQENVVVTVPPPVPAPSQAYTGYP